MGRFFKFFKKKSKKLSKDELRLEEYEMGKILQVDGETDNKEYFKSLENKPIEKEKYTEPIKPEQIEAKKPEIKALPSSEEFYKPGFKLFEEKDGTEEVSE